MRGCVEVCPQAEERGHFASSRGGLPCVLRALSGWGVQRFAGLS